MKNFIDHIQKSIFSPPYYRELLGQPASYSWKYYSSFTLLLALLMTILLSIPLVPKVDQFVEKIEPAVLAYFPDDLEIKVTKGEVSINQPEPYTLPLPALMQDGSGATSTLLVVDTTQELSLAQYEKYHTLILLGKHAVMTGDNTRGIRIVPFDKSLDLTINESGIRTIFDQISPVKHFVAPSLVLFVFIAFIISFVILLLYLLLDALFILILGRLLKYKWSFGTSYRIGLHAVTLPLFLSSAVSLLPIGDVNLPFFTSITTLIVVYLNFREHPAPTPAPVKEPLDKIYG